MNIQEEYDYLINDSTTDVVVFNKLVYILSSNNFESILEELAKDSVCLAFSTRFAVLTLKDWLEQINNNDYKHTVYFGDDEFIKTLYKSCQYQWFKLIDSPTEITVDMINSKIVGIQRMSHKQLLEVITADTNLLTMFCILAKTSFSECYLRLLIKENRK